MQSHAPLLEAETGSLKAWAPGVLRPILDPTVADMGSQHELPNPLRMA